MDTHEKNKHLSQKIWDMAEQLRTEVDINSYKESLLQILLLKSMSEPNYSKKTK